MSEQSTPLVWLTDEGLDTFCRLPADRDGYPRPEGLEVLLHFQGHYDNLCESEAKRRGEQWRECARRYPHAALAIDMDGDDKKRSARGTPAHKNYMRLWAHHAGMDDPATAWRILGPGSPSWRRAHFDLLSMAMCGVFGDESGELARKGHAGKEEVLRVVANLAGIPDYRPRLLWTVRDMEHALKCRFTDWRQRWKSDRYYVTYKVGQVEETFSFTPAEIDEAIQVTFEMASMWTPVGEQGGIDVQRAVDDTARISHNIIEYLVKHKHGCRQVLDPGLLPRGVEPAIKRLIRSGYVPRSDADQRLWSMLILGLVTWFRDKPADHDHLEITDIEPGKLGDGVMWNPLLSNEEIARKMDEASTLGMREITSRRHLEGEEKAQCE
jgi:hypothetical protein